MMKRLSAPAEAAPKTPGGQSHSIAISAVMPISNAMLRALFGRAGSWNALVALSELKRDGALEELPDAAASLRKSLEPISPIWLKKRLVAVGMMLAPNRSADDASIWVRETARLLGHLPEDIFHSRRVVLMNKHLQQYRVACTVTLALK